MWRCIRLSVWFISETSSRIFMIFVVGAVCTVCETWESHGGERAPCGLLGCGAVWLCKWLPTFQRKISPPSSGWSAIVNDLYDCAASESRSISTPLSLWSSYSGLKMEAIHLSETLLIANKTILRHIPGHYSRQLHRRGNFISVTSPWRWRRYILLKHW